LVDAGATKATATGDPARFEKAHEALRADASLQFELTDFQPPVVPEWLRWLGRLLEGSGPFFKLLFWIVLGLAVLAILYWLFRWVERGGLAFLRRARATEQTSGEAWRPDEAPARALLVEADALAAIGRFSEAAHLLLFRSIEEIDRKRPSVVRPALTSRDIARAEGVPPAPRSAFARIVMAVERSLFGGRSLDAADWTDCRTAYEEFAFAAEWRN
jgi:hypothetical protein